MRPSDTKTDLTVVKLKSLIRYNKETGDFIWIKTGILAGHVDNSGYVRITINGRRFLAHRLAWLYVYEEWPKDRLDHKNRNRSDNRWDNLRAANDAQNVMNRNVKKDNFLGIKGIRLHECGKYQARIFANGKFRTRVCNSLEEAISIYKSMASEEFGDFAT